MATTIKVHNVEFSRVHYYMSENFVEFETSSILNEDQLDDALKVVVKDFPYSDQWFVRCEDSDGDDLEIKLYTDECSEFPYNCSYKEIISKDRVFRSEFVDEYSNVRKEFYDFEE